MFKREKKENLEMVFGIRPTIEAIKSGKEVEKILIQNGIQGELFSELNALIKTTKIPYQYVPAEKLNRTTGKNHQGIIAFISPITFHKIENIIPELYEQGKTPLLLILDRVTDIRNFGAIARTAECAGVQAIIIPSRGSAQINSDAIKTSAGALFKIPVCREENLKWTLDFLKDSGIQLVACTEKTDELHFDINYSNPTAIIMGSEEDGISPEYLKKSDFKAKIPLLGDIDSLNVSVACGVILYEALRQRKLN